jgi:hypothetical protein
LELDTGVELDVEVEIVVELELEFEAVYGAGVLEVDCDSTVVGRGCSRSRLNTSPNWPDFGVVKSPNPKEDPVSIHFPVGSGEKCCWGD